MRFMYDKVIVNDMEAFSALHQEECSNTKFEPSLRALLPAYPAYFREMVRNESPEKVFEEVLSLFNNAPHLGENDNREVGTQHRLFRALMILDLLVREGNNDALVKNRIISSIGIKGIQVAFDFCLDLVKDGGSSLNHVFVQCALSNMAALISAFEYRFFESGKLSTTLSLLLNQPDDCLYGVLKVLDSIITADDAKLNISQKKAVTDFFEKAFQRVAFMDDIMIDTVCTACSRIPSLTMHLHNNDYFASLRAYLIKLDANFNDVYSLAGAKHYSMEAVQINANFRISTAILVLVGKLIVYMDHINAPFEMRMELFTSFVEKTLGFRDISYGDALLKCHKVAFDIVLFTMAKFLTTYKFAFRTTILQYVKNELYWLVAEVVKNPNKLTRAAVDVLTTCFNTISNVLSTEQVETPSFNSSEWIYSLASVYHSLVKEPVFQFSEDLICTGTRALHISINFGARQLTTSDTSRSLELWVSALCAVSKLSMRRAQADVINAIRDLAMHCNINRCDIDYIVHLFNSGSQMASSDVSAACADALRKTSVICERLKTTCVEANSRPMLADNLRGGGQKMKRGHSEMSSQTPEVISRVLGGYELDSFEGKQDGYVGKRVKVASANNDCSGASTMYEFPQAPEVSRPTSADGLVHHDITEARAHYLLNNESSNRSASAGIVSGQVNGSDVTMQESIVSLPASVMRVDVDDDEEFMNFKSMLNKQ